MALPKIANKFSSAIQKTEQEQKIIELQKEVERLRAIQSPELEKELQQLREQLVQQSGEVQVEVKLIDPNPHQPRQTITSDSIEAKKRLLKKHGQISSIILLPQDNGRYLLLDGQLRWEAAKHLGWSTIRAVVTNPPQDINQFSLLTFLGFEDLNPLDKAEAIFTELSKATGLMLSEVSTLLATVLKRTEREKKTKELSKLVNVSTEEQIKGLEKLGFRETEKNILLILLELGLNPSSVKANLMPMLSLPQDLKEAIRQQGLKGAHALALTTISAKTLDVSEKKAKKERVAATVKVWQEHLTVPETRELVKKIRAKYLKPQKSESKEVRAAIDKIKKLSDNALASASNEQLQQLHTLLQGKLAEIDKVLAATEAEK